MEVNVKGITIVFDDFSYNAHLEKWEDAVVVPRVDDVVVLAGDSHIVRAVIWDGVGYVHVQVERR